MTTGRQRWTPDVSEVQQLRVDPAGGGVLGQGVREGELPGSLRESGKLHKVHQREDQLQHRQRRSSV